MKGRPRTKERDERVKEIMAAAKVAFFKKGYFNSTIEDIAQRAGISKGTVYLYFKNKDELYASLMLPLVDEFTELLIEFEKGVSREEYKSGAEIIMKFYETFTRIYHYDPDSLRVFQVYHLLDLSDVLGESVRKKHRSIAKRNGAIAVKIYSDAINQGLLLQNDPVQVVSALWALFLGVVQVQGSYLRVTGKDHVLDTLKFGFSSFAKVLSRTPEKSEGEAA